MTYNGELRTGSAQKKFNVHLSTRPAVFRVEKHRHFLRHNRALLQLSFLLHACSGTMTRRRLYLRCMVRSLSALSDHSHQCRSLGHLDGAVYISVHFTWASVWHSAPHFMCASTGSIFVLGKCLSAHLNESVAGTYQFHCVALRSMSGFGGSNFKSLEHLEWHTVLVRLIRGRLIFLWSAGCRGHGSIGGRPRPGYFCHQYLTNWLLRRRVVVCVSTTGFVARVLPSWSP